MDVERIGRIIERAKKRNPKPVLVVTVRHYGKDKKYHKIRCCGVLGCWNGIELWFDRRPAVIRKGKVVSAYISRPFYHDCIVSIKVVSQEDLVNYTNCLFDISEDVERMREKLDNKS